MMNCDRFRKLFLKLMESVMNCIRFLQHSSRQLKTALGKGFGIALGLALIVLVIISTFSMSTMSQAIEPRKFPDVPEKSWYASDLKYITSDARRILEGSSDGNFYPKNTLSVEQFLKCVVVAANQRPSAVGGYWAQPFIDKALQLGIITSGQFKTYRTGITRGEMAVIIRSAFEIMTDEKDPVVDISTISKRMGDYALIPTSQQESVCFAYSLGILTGMPDGKFHPEGILSRAEAVAVIRRVIDPTARVKPATTGEPADGEQTDGNTVEVWSDAEFQAFMSTDEWKQYLNPNTIAGMKDGVLLFQKLVYPEDFAETGDLSLLVRVPNKLPEDLYVKYYQITKAVAFFAKEYHGTATIGYDDQLGGVVEYCSSSLGKWTGQGAVMAFQLNIADIHSARPYLSEFIPETRGINVEHEWILNLVNSKTDTGISSIQTQQYRYVGMAEESVFNCVSKLVYGQDTGTVVAKTMLSAYEGILEKSYLQTEIIGKIIGNEIVVFSRYPFFMNRTCFYIARVMK